MKKLVHTTLVMGSILGSWRGDEVLRLMGEYFAYNFSTEEKIVQLHQSHERGFDIFYLGLPKEKALVVLIPGYKIGVRNVL